MSKRIAIVGFSIESSTFSPYVNDANDFTVLSGKDLLKWYPFLENLPSDSVFNKDVEWVFLTRARSLPGGIVDDDFYVKTKHKIIHNLKAEIATNGVLDGVLVDIHGAMSVYNIKDAEYNFIKSIRKVVGKDTLISVTTDLHANITKELLGEIDLITCYRTAPHIDVMDTKKRAITNLLERLNLPKGKQKPYKVFASIPVLLSGEQTSTRMEPAKTLYKKVEEIANKDNILDACLFVGYVWADEARSRASVVITGDDENLIKNQATNLAQSYWDKRDEFQFVADASQLSDCINKFNEYYATTLQNRHKPFVISDSGDNITAGGTGDVTWSLHQLLKHPILTGKSVIYASIFDKNAAIKIAQKNIGDNINMEIGANIDDISAGKIRIRGIVHSIYSGAKGIEVVINVNGIYIIITEKRKPYHYKKDFYNLDLQPENVDLLIVKIGYLEPELFDLSANGKCWELALTPGAVNQNVLKLKYTRILSKTYPFYKPKDVDDANAIKNSISAQTVK
jgi:microcystin degradation protein MlrC